MRCVHLESGFLQPLKIRDTRVREEWLTRCEPASHPLRTNLRVVAKTKSDNEHHWETVQGPPRPLRPFLQMTPGSTHRRGMQADEQERAVGHFTGEFDHARSRRQQVH